MTYSQLNAMLAESGLARDEVNELAAVLSPLASISEQAAPTPSAELMRIFAGEGRDGASLAQRRGRQQHSRGHRAKGTVAGVVVLALSGVGATGLSAAANTLPSTWQHGVAGFSRHYLPFDFPEPAAKPRRDSSRPPDAGRMVRGNADPLRGRRAEPTETTRSAERERFATTGGPSWHGRDHGSQGAPDDRSGSTGYSAPQGPYAQDEAPVGTLSSPDNGAGHGGHDGRGPSMGDDDADGKGKDETGNKNGNNVDHSDQGDRPVKGGNVGAPNDVQKGPQKGPHTEPQKGSPKDAQKGQPGRGDQGGGSVSPGGADGTGPHDEPGAQGSEDEPLVKDVPTGPAGDLLPG